MHVSKLVLAVVAAIILALTAALSYMAGKSEGGSPRVSDVSSTQPATKLAITPSEPIIDVVKVESLQPAKEKPQPEPASKEFTLTEQRLIDKFFEGEDMCRGSSDADTVEIWCPRRDAAYRAMISGGICFGHEDDGSAADSKVHRCRRGSYK